MSGHARAPGRGGALTSRPKASSGALPIRWRLLSIAALNATVAVILAALIWNGANVLSRAWDDVRKVRESDKLLVSAGKRGQPAAEPDPPLHQSAEPGGLRRNPAAARRGAEHVAQPRRGRSGSVRLGRRTARGDRAVSAGLRRGARGPDHDHADLRERGAQAGQGNGRALRHHRRRHRQARRLAAGRRSASRARRSPRAWSPPTPSICRWPPTPPTRRAGTSRRSSRPSR